MAAYNPFQRSGGFEEEKFVHVETLSNEQALNRAARIAADKATQKKLPDLFKVVVPRAVQAQHELRIMRMERSRYEWSTHWIELQVNGGLIIHGKHDFKWPGHCPFCTSYGRGCGSRVDADDRGERKCWFGRDRHYAADWHATQTMLKGLSQ